MALLAGTGTEKHQKTGLHPDTPGNPRGADGSSVLSMGRR